MPSGSSTITVSWIPPDPLTGLAKTTDEEMSHIRLNWSPSLLSDTDFNKYAVYRKEPNDSLFVVLGEVMSKETPAFTDITAGQVVPYEYKVTQFKTVALAPALESADGDIVAAALEADVWFVIGNADPAETDFSFELPVIEETHTRPIQQEVFEPIVRNRKKVARGNVLGYEGAFTLSWDATERDLAKSYLDFLAHNPGPHVLKSPFGDVWHVEFDAPEYRYAHAGHLTVEIGWVEVFDILDVASHS